MGKAKKIGIGIGITVLFFVIVGIVPAFQGSSSTSNSSQFDPEITQFALEELDVMNELFGGLLNVCKAVESNSDYEYLRGEMYKIGDDSFDELKEINEDVFNFVELSYDDHPTVGPVINEYFEIVDDFNNRIEKKELLYG